MARGWESKSVESQMESVEERRKSSQAARLSAEQIARQRERESIELSRTRVLQDLASATSPRYRELLQKSLKFLDEKIAALDQPTSEKKAKSQSA